MSITVHGADVEYMKFSAGEPHVKVTNINKAVKIYWKFENFEEFMYVAMIVNVVYPSTDTLILEMPYVPFARQDRMTTKEQPFSLSVFCDMLKTLKIDQLIVKDVHSDVFNNLMERASFDIELHTQVYCAASVIPVGSSPYDCIIAPDSGAVAKAGDFATIMEKPLVCATKVRDPLTGQLSSPTIDFGDLKPKLALIPDDICDGGYTFIQLADVIKQQFPEIVLDLYVTHGVFSRGKEELNKRFNQIYVYNDMSKKE